MKFRNSKAIRLHTFLISARYQITCLDYYEEAGYSPGDVMLYATQVAPLSKSMQDSEVFLEKPSMTIKFSKHAGISTSDTNMKFKYLSPAMSVALMVSPK